MLGQFDLVGIPPAPRGVPQIEAGGVLRTSTRPTSNPPLLCILRSPVCAFTAKVSHGHGPISVECFVLNDPPAR